MTSLRPALFVLCALALGTACSRSSHEEHGGVRSVTDDLGRSVRFDAAPERIVSLAPSLTEMFFVLGEQERLCAVTSYCNYPPEAREKPSVGDLLTPDIERILALDADLVFISVEGNTHQTFAALQRMGVKVFVSNPRDIDGVCKSLADIGQVTGAEDRARRVVDSLRGIQADLGGRAVADTQSVLLLISAQPIMAAGRETFLGEIIRLAGGRNAAAGVAGNYPTLSREAVVEMNPDIILFPDDMHAAVRDLRRRFPEWRHVSAVRKEQVHAMDADVFLRPGPRIFSGALQLQDWLIEAERTLQR